MLSLPKINTPYWVALMAASVFGTNTGDWVADVLHIGHLEGLPWMGTMLVLIFITERLFSWRTAFFFWAAIITVRTAATNIGDAFHSYHIGFSISLPMMTLALVLAALLYKARGGGVREDGTAKVDWIYWCCMALAGAWGTIAGDFVAFGLTQPPLFPPGGTLLLSAVLVVIFWAGRNGRLTQPFYYWFAVAIIRAAGTCAGDALAHGMGLNDSTIMTGAVFVALIAVFYGLDKQNEITIGRRINNLSSVG